MVCAFGNAIDCVQASQRMNVRELERLRTTMQQSSAETSWATLELSKFEQTGPEIVFQLTNRDFASEADLSTAIEARLSRFVEMPHADTSRSTAQADENTESAGSTNGKEKQEEDSQELVQLRGRSKREKMSYRHASDLEKIPPKAYAEILDAVARLNSAPGPWPIATSHHSEDHLIQRHYGIELVLIWRRIQFPFEAEPGN
jgi:hypothetical protein